MKLFIVVVILLLVFPALIAAQQNDRSDGMQGMPGMGHDQMQGMQMDQHAPMQMSPRTFLEEILGHDTSGTSAQPNSTPSPMLMTKKGAWMLMFPANVFV